MNVAFEQIRRTFAVPKAVMHLIVHHVRPRAPGPPREWLVRWEGGWLIFGPWATASNVVYRCHEGGCEFHCPYCLQGPLQHNVVCSDCRNELYFLANRVE